MIKNWWDRSFVEYEDGQIVKIGDVFLYPFSKQGQVVSKYIFQAYGATHSSILFQQCKLVCRAS